MRQALILGLADKNIENYGLISINAKGEEYLRSPFPVMITLDHDYDAEEREAEAAAPAEETAPADEPAAPETEAAPAEAAEPVTLPDLSEERPVCDPEAPNPNPVEAGPAVAPKDENGKFDPTKIADVSDFGDWEEQGCKG